MNPIQGPSSVTPIRPPAQLTGATKTNGESFKNLFLEAIDHVNTMQHDADKAVEQLTTGGDVNTAEVLTMIQKSDLSFRMMLQIRNKLVQAYQEVREIRI